jgi:hypothetical protein
MGAKRAVSPSDKLRVTLTLNIHGGIDGREQE